MYTYYKLLKLNKRPVLFAVAFILLFSLTACEYANTGTSEVPESFPSTASTTTTTTTTTTTVSSSTTATTTAVIATHSTTETATSKTSTTATSAKVPTVSETAQEILATMSIEQKVGQMFIARCPESGSKESISQYNLGGYILFARDFAKEDKSSFKAKIKTYQDASKINMLIAVDEEGGSVVRVSKYKNFRSSPFNSPLYIYSKGGADALTSDAKEKSELLLSLGINMNFAPVCDLPDSSFNYIYKRTLGKNLSDTVTGIRAIVTQMSKSNMISVLKHFPGYGNNSDTHTGSAIDKRPYSDFENEDFKPFIAGMGAGADCVLVSHNTVKCMDANSPASLSLKVHEILRKDLGFNGVIITDDLAMDAIKKYSGSSNSAVLAVKAGNDLICCTDFKTQIPAVVNAVKSGEIPIEQIDESVLRILNMKINHKIIQ